MSFLNLSTYLNTHHFFKNLSPPFSKDIIQQHYPSAISKSHQNTYINTYCVKLNLFSLVFLITTEITNGSKKYQAGTASRTHYKKKSTHTHIQKTTSSVSLSVNQFQLQFWNTLSLLFPELPWGFVVLFRVLTPRC